MTIEVMQLGMLKTMAAQDDEIKTLRTQIAECAVYLKEGETPAQRIQRELADTDAVLTLLAAEKRETESLRAQVEQYKEDAERYRWLRDTNLDAGVRATGEHLEPLQVPMIFIGHPEDQWTLGSFASAWVGEKFDRAIDAAIDKARKTT